MSRSFFPGGASKWRRFSLIFAALSCLSSCAASPHLNGSQSSHLIEKVPFFPQEIYQCGPASLAGVLNYWGIPVTPEEIASEIYSRSAKGTLNIDMVLYAEKKGLKAELYQGSVNDLKNKIDSGFPLIVMVDYGFGMVRQNHFMVVVGHGKNSIIANSGRERLKAISLKGFINSWKRTKFWTLWITPRS
ncbi:MAG: C39 family peptidase [Thermodesulfobacteriota bacterium]|nr:C39 family peptidase [Thermodesulfobacteriota bacterium]